MEQIKRQHSIGDEQTNKKSTGSSESSSRDFITSFEDMSNEILYEIFDLLDFFQAYETFVTLNRRFENLFAYSTLPIKLKLLSTSNSTFRRYHTQIIMPNQHRIRSLHLSNPFFIDRVFSSICNGLKLPQLQTLILEKIHSTYLESLLKYLLVLPYLSSLIVDCEDQIENKHSLYYEIFRLSRLKYCKLSFNELNRSEPLPMATNQCSPIEHLILICPYPLNDLHNLLSYIPHLKHLSIHSTNHLPIEQMPQCLSALTHASFKGLNLPFDLLESNVQTLFSQIQVLHLSIRYRVQYLDADRWQRLIQSNMPKLRIFDIHIELDLNYPIDMANFIPRIEKFCSPFWSKRQWVFEYHTLKNVDRNLLHFFSTNPYRRKQYKIYAKADDISREKRILNSVHQLQIQNGKAVLRCGNYFPNTTELIISHRVREERSNLHSTSLNSILPLNGLTKLVLRLYHDDFGTIIKLLQYTPHIYTFEIENISFSSSNFVLMAESEAFRFVSQTNSIRNLIIHHHQTQNILKFLADLCPRLHQLSIVFDNDLQLFLQYLFSNNHSRLKNLFLLRITSVSVDDMKTLKNFLNQEKLLSRDSLQMQYNEFNKNMYLWR